MAGKEEKKIGRPTIFSPEIGEELCLLMMTTKLPNNSMTKICNQDRMPCRTTIYLWLLDAAKADATPEQKEFLNRYKIACNIRLDNMFDETFEIAYDDEGDLIDTPLGEKGNTTNVSRARLKIDAIKWALCKLNPEKYGDRIKQDHSIAGVMPIDKASELTRMMKEAIEKREE